MDTADVFQTLGLGINFDKRRFGKDIALFEGSSGLKGTSKTSIDREGDDEATLDATARPGLSRGGAEGAGPPSEASTPAFLDSLPHVSTRDPNEEANVIRKLHHIRVSGSLPPPPLRTFAQLACEGEGRGDPRPSRLLRNLAGAGFLEPTPIQRQAIPALLARRELLASARVLALLLPGLGLRAALLSKATAAGTDFARVDVLLANPLRLAALAGGQGQGAGGREAEGQAPPRGEEPRSGAERQPHQHPPGELSGTRVPASRDPPDTTQPRRLDLSQVRTLVLDEADKLFDMGFTPQVDAVLAAATHPDLVRALFSATLPETVESMARSVLHDPLRITVGERGNASAAVTQALQFVGREAGKALALRQLLAGGVKPPILVFVASRERAKEVHRELRFDGVHVDCIHSDQSDAARGAAIASFRRGSTWVLIATDLLGRGMDFPGVNTVVNYDCPRSTTDYVHRVGRTGRAGRAGSAITFFTEEDVKYLRGIANVVRASGSPVPDWMLALRKERRRKRSDPEQAVALEEGDVAADGDAAMEGGSSQKATAKPAREVRTRPKKAKKEDGSTEQAAPDRPKAAHKKPKKS
ncbi:DEAD-box ATP-dependent RNA helicase 57 [Auxenochlorella protothecoides]|uniref:RNA helicase n=1 Tax=Auxenochlorella protothecoides TaxID=3075 RepID=A0A087SN42_AUXPR|nr:DEAD-box ATP-dependent RNA helicase 57 [Auxenochlorella protothecoides]KFM27146.1 DEAD-box ATP-dependent RNA helicase 57 [Auxenochlorella protothecoides]